MSTYSMTVTGPNARLTMIKGWFAGLAAHARSWWHTATRSITRTTTAVKGIAKVALGAIGSTTGYALTTGIAQSAVRTVWRGLKWVASKTSRLLGRATRTLYTVTGLVSPAAAALLEDTVERFIVEPLLNTGLWFDGWISNIGNVTIDLMATGLVRTVTTKAAQGFAIILSIHTITRGALAAKIVQAVPWAMDAVVWATNPMVALGVVGAVFVGGIIVAGLSLLWGSQPEDDDDDPDERPIDIVTDPEPEPQEEPATNLEQLVIPWDMADIAAHLRIEASSFTASPTRSRETLGSRSPPSPQKQRWHDWSGSCPIGKPSTATTDGCSPRWLDKQSARRHSANTPHNRKGRAYGPAPQGLSRLGAEVPHGKTQRGRN